MKLTTFICLMILSGLVIVSYCQAFHGIGNWADCVLPIRTHGAFLPHPHMRDLRIAAKRGKILVITLVVSAGLVALVSTAVLKGGKGKEKADTTKTVDPAALRSLVIAAAVAGRRGLTESRERALDMALSTYASTSGVEWENEAPRYAPSVTRNIGGDRVTVVIPSDSAAVEVRAICGNIGASAVASAVDDSVRSSIFTSRALETEANT